MIEKFNNSIIYASYMFTNSQLADMLTKSVSNLAFQTLIGKLMIENIYSSAREGALKR